MMGKSKTAVSLSPHSEVDSCKEGEGGVNLCGRGLMYQSKNQ